MNMLISPKQNKDLGEKGFASIVITLILIIVLALVTIGFAQLARREQRDALDKQLANQAYYAAESGVNDTVKNLGAIAAANPPTNQCLDTANFSLNPVIDQTRGVSYSCILVNTTPPNLLYNNVLAEEDRYVTFSTSHNPLSSLTIQWGSADNKTTYKAGNSFTPLGQWGNSPAVLEVSLTPLGTGALQRSNIVASNFTVYLYPHNGGGSTVAYNTASQGQIRGRCTGSGAYPCRLTINGLPGGLTGQWYLLHIVDHYDPSNINITGSVGGTSVNFIDGQAQIDVTGKAREVLKRIQVRVPIHPPYDLPKYTIEAQNACKRYTTYPTTPSTDVTTFDSLDPSCTLN